MILDQKLNHLKNEVYQIRAGRHRLVTLQAAERLWALVEWYADKSTRVSNVFNFCFSIRGYKKEHSVLFSFLLSAKLRDKIFLLKGISQ